MPVTSTASTFPTVAGPVITGAPVAGRFSGRLMCTVRVATPDQSRSVVQTWLLEITMRSSSAYS